MTNFRDIFIAELEQCMKDNGVIACRAANIILHEMAEAAQVYADSCPNERQEPIGMVQIPEIPQIRPTGRKDRTYYCGGCGKQIDFDWDLCPKCEDEWEEAYVFEDDEDPDDIPF